ncbi:VOC family protein [Amycolatopsis anabasis]|uniref:VOC family protein n=1 Tax=Amycolatopsis anabasis TaxID=1840409 RepID=UPI00131C8DDA|nr:VOC family protein [Amycolatopsis anabasis]
MVVRKTAWPEGTPCWVDLGVDDFGKAQSFYRGLFGWDVQVGPPETGGYAVAHLDGKPVAGIMPKMDPGQPTVWTTYLAVDDADATAAKIQPAGGQVIAPPMDVLDLGRMAAGSDVEGAVFGLWQSGTHTGADIVNVPGSLVWNEQMSRDFPGAKKFYAAVFGYEYADMGDNGFQYATIRVGDREVGGIGGLTADTPLDTPAQWTAYFGVADTDETAALIAKLGGEVVGEPHDTPYGRMANVADDQGARFAIIDLSATG